MLDWPSVKAGLRDIDSRELTEWAVYERLYGPVNPNERMEWMVATLIAITVNMWKAADADPVEPDQFVPKFGAAKQEEPEEPQSPKQMLHIIEMWNAALGGVDLRDKKDA